MENYDYDINLRTPLGLRAGKLFLSINEGSVKGELNLLGYKTPVEGSVEKEGKCLLSGEIKTFMSTMPFTAEGTADGHGIKLKLKTQKNNFTLTGNT